MMQELWQHKKQIMITILLFIAVALGCLVAYKQYVGRPEYVVREYVLALQQKRYSKAYSYLLIRPNSLNSKENFVRQMQFWDYNSELDKESYLAGLKGELQSLELSEFSPSEQAQQAEPFSLADLQQQLVEQQKLTGVKPTWKYFAVQAVVRDTAGAEHNVHTTLAVQLDTSFMGRLLARNAVVDPCLLRTVLLEVEDNTKVELNGVELSQYKQTNYNTLIYRVEQLFPGRYRIKLTNPLADAYEGNMRLDSLAKASSRFNLCGRLQLRKQNDEAFVADTAVKKTDFVKHTAYVKGYDVFLKDRPSTGGQIIAVLQRGETLDVLDEKQCEDKQAAIVAADVTVDYNGTQLELKRGQPLKLIDELQDAYLCRLNLEDSSGFIEVPKDKLHSLVGSNWYLVRDAAGKEGWVYSEFVTK